MKTVELAQVANIERKGVSPSSVSPETPYLGLEHIERGGRIVGRDTVGGAGLVSTKFRFSAEHVLFGKLRPNLGKVSRPDFAGVCSTDILPIKPGKNLDRNYLAHYLAQQAMIDFAASRTTGANLPRLSPKVLATFPIPLPPVHEQRRIAAILDQADSIRAKRRQVLAHLDTLTQSIFDATLFHDDPVVTLGQSLTFITSGGRGWAKYYSETGERFIQSLDVQMGTISDRDPVFVMAPNNAEARRTRSQPGDVLLTITGSRIGRAAPLPRTLSGAYVSQHVAILRPDPESLRPDYLSTMLCLPRLGQRLIKSSQYGQTKPGLNFEQIRRFPLPRPSLQRQDEFIARKARVDTIKKRLGEELGQTEALFASLQSRGFKGEL